MEIDVLALLEAACNKRYRVTASPKCKIGFVISKCDWVIGKKLSVHLTNFSLSLHKRSVDQDPGKIDSSYRIAQSLIYSNNS